jgi:hypothetical protein
MLRDLDAGRDSLRQPVVRGRRVGHGHVHDALGGACAWPIDSLCVLLSSWRPLGLGSGLVAGLGRLARDGMLTATT